MVKHEIKVFEHYMYKHDFVEVDNSIMVISEIVCTLEELLYVIMFTNPIKRHLANRNLIIDKLRALCKENGKDERDVEILLKHYL